MTFIIRFLYNFLKLFICNPKIYTWNTYGSRKSASSAHITKHIILWDLVSLNDDHLAFWYEQKKSNNICKNDLLCSFHLWSTIMMMMTMMLCMMILYICCWYKNHWSQKIRKYDRISSMNYLLQFFLLLFML